MQVLKDKWESKRYGTLVGSDAAQQRLTFAMFADDTTLIARSRGALWAMLADIIAELSKVGLNLNAEKCNVQCSKATTKARPPLVVGDMSFKVVDQNEGFKVLGTTFTLNGNTTKEYESRLDAAWAKFHELKPLLCRREASMSKRLQLFGSTVSKTALWGAESWTLTVKQKRHLRAVQRSMLRRMVGPRRAPDEEYIPWIKRATKIADDRATNAGVQCWLRQHLWMKWQWAGRIANMSEERWAKRVTLWRDSIWQTEASSERDRPLRARPGNRMRWEDEVRRYTSEAWHMASSRVGRGDLPKQ
jgi:hypothetical protein